MPLSEPRPVTVAFLLQDFSAGGIGQWIYTLCRELHRTDPGRFAFHFVCSHGWEIRRRFHDVGTATFVGHAGRPPTWFVWWRMTRYLKRIAPDIIQFSNLREYRDVCRRVRPPVVIERKAGLRTLNRYDLGGVHAVVCQNREVCELLDFPADRKFLVYHGVDLEELRRVERNRLGFAPDDIIVGQVSRIGRGQNHQLLIDAVVRLRERHPRVKLVLVGGTTPQPGAVDLLPQLREQARPLGPHAVLTGHMDEPDAIVAGFDIATCTSTRAFTEGAPRKLIEPMAFGIPCVTTDSGATREAVEDGVEGFVVEDGNLAQFTERLERLVVDEALRAEMGRAARRKVERLFDIRRQAQEMKEIWLSLLGSAAAGQRRRASGA